MSIWEFPSWRIPTTTIKSAHFISTPDEAIFCHNNLNIKCRSHEEGCEVQRGDTSEVIQGAKFQRHGVEEFINVVQDPTFELDELGFQFHPLENKTKETVRLRKMALKDQDHLLNVKCFKYRTEVCVDYFLTILAFLKPGSLERIELTCQKSVGPVMEKFENLEKLVKMEHWKKLKSVSLKGFDFNAPIEKLFHLETFKIEKRGISKNDLKKMKDVLLLSNNFTGCEILLSKEPYCTELSRKMVQTLFPGQENERGFVYTVPGTKRKFTFSLDAHFVRVKKGDHCPFYADYGFFVI